MFKNLKLGVKMGIGFGVLIAIAVSLGGIAIWQMKKVETNAALLSNEYVPEVALASNIEKNALTTMFQIRGYAFTENAEYLEKGKLSLKEVKNNLQAADTLINKSSTLKDIKGTNTATANHISQYEQLLEDSILKIEAMAKNRMDFNQNALIFAATAKEFSSSQDQMMTEEITKSQKQTQERINKFILTNDIIELTYQTRMAIWKSIAIQDVATISDALKNFDAINKKLDELLSMTAEETNRQRIDSIRKSGANYKTGMEKIITQWNSLVGTAGNKEALDTIIKELVAIITVYLQNCNSFFTAQKEAMQEEIKISFTTIADRKNKINLVNTIVNRGNEIRVATWKSQVLRDQKIITEIQPEFDLLSNQLDALKAITKQEVNLKQIELNRNSVNNLKTALGNLLQNWQGLQELTKQRETESNLVLNLARKTADTGMNSVMNVANQAVSSLSSASITMIIGLIIAFVLAITIAVIITRGITGPIIKGVEFSSIVAAGDLTHQLNVEQNDEIGQLAYSLNRMCDNLKDVIANIHQAAEQVASSAEELSASSENLASGASEQAASLEETTASMEQISRSIQQNSQNAKDASRMAQMTTKGMDDIMIRTGESRKICEETVTLAMRGGSTVNEMVDSMNQISACSKKVAAIIDVIDDIADQTNLLALNAAIEAARAGEMGKGFAVVAVEVRKLAERSQTAAKEIAGMISENILQIEKGVLLAGKSGESLEKIVGSIGEVSQSVQVVSGSNQEQLNHINETNRLVQEISVFCDEQSASIKQICQAIVQLDQVTQQNSSNSEESASASEELATQAQMLQEMVARFKINGDAIHQPVMPASNKTNLYKTSTSKTATIKPNNRLLSINTNESIPRFAAKEKNEEFVVMK